MAHRDPSSPSWALARHSKALWEEIASGQQQQHTSSALQEALEWQANGSLLLATTDAEVLQLQQRAQMLQQQGVPGVVLLSPREMLMLEPALQMPPGSRGLLVKSDAQIVSVTNQGCSCVCEPDPQQHLANQVDVLCLLPGQHVWLWYAAGQHSKCQPLGFGAQGISSTVLIQTCVSSTSESPPPTNRHWTADSMAVCLRWMSALHECC